MTVYVITENRTQSTFINKFGDEATPITRVLGARKTHDAALAFKRRMNNMLQEEAFVEGSTEDISVEIVPVTMPD